MNLAVFELFACLRWKQRSKMTTEVGLRDTGPVCYEMTCYHVFDEKCLYFSQSASGLQVTDDKLKSCNQYHEGILYICILQCVICSMQYAFCTWSAFCTQPTACIFYWPDRNPNSRNSSNISSGMSKRGLASRSFLFLISWGNSNNSQQQFLGWQA